MSSFAGLWREGKSGVEVRVRVTPKGSQDCVEGIEPTAYGPALKIRVRAAADRGEANRAVEKVFAGWLGVPRTSVAISVGAASRYKTIEIAGPADAIVPALKDRLAVLMSPHGEQRANKTARG